MASEPLNKLLNMLFPRYCVQWWKDFGNGFMCGRGTGELTLNEAKKELERLSSDGRNARLYRVNVMGSQVTTIFPAIEEVNQI